MADHQPTNDRLIEEHLAQLRSSLRGRPGADQIVEELRDHLLEATAHHERAGLTATDAAQRAIEELGRPDEVAASFARNRHGGAAVPTGFTRATGLAGPVVALATLAAPLLFAMGRRVEEREGWSSTAQLWDAFGAIAVFVGSLALLALALGTVRRCGGLGVAGTAGTALVALGALLSIVVWAVWVWPPLLAAGWVLIAGSARREGAIPMGPIGAIAAGLAVPATLVIVNNALVPDWGDPLWLHRLGGGLLALGFVALAAGATMLGLRLGGEAPIEAPAEPTLA